MDADPTTALAPPAAQVGRPRDATRDTAILKAARELLAERGYEGMTMDAVAARAGAGKATLYRRWPSKTDLAVDAVMCGPGKDLAVTDVPDTGSLTGDLDALERLRHARKAAAADDLIPGLLAEVRRDPELARTFQAAFVQPKIDQVRGLLERARKRGEVSPEHDLDLLATVVPAMVSYRKLIVGAPHDPTYPARLLHEVLVPLATSPGASPGPGAGTPAERNTTSRQR